MNIVRRAAAFRRETSGDDVWGRLLASSAPTAAGKAVDESSAMRSTVVYACVRVIAETIASLPCITYRRLDRGKERAPTHRLARLLHDRPNPELTSYQFRVMLLGHALLWDNAFAEIERGRDGLPVALWPLRPDRMTITRDDRDRLRYVYSLPNGQPHVFLPEQVHHISGAGMSELLGGSRIHYGREAIGLALAAEEYGARFFANDSRTPIVLTHPGTLSETALKNIKESWEDAHRPLSKKHRVGILSEGMGVIQIGIPPNAAQFLETRKFQALEIARLFRVPPHLIGELDRATWGNIEHQAIDFVTHVIRPWLVCIEQAMDRDLFAKTDPLPMIDGIETGQRAHLAEFLVDGLLRGDAASRATALATQRQNGIITANEWREIENRNPIDGGDELLVNGNMVPVDQAGQAPASAGEAAERALAAVRELRALPALATNGRGH